MGPIRTKLEAILARLAQRADSERVFTQIYAQAAREQADTADQRSDNGQSLGPLDGRIVSIKDLFDVEGEPTLAGSNIRRSSPPATRDARVVERLKQAGAVIVGKTHMTEFAFTAVGLNPHIGVPGNAVDTTRIPGGSSSGAAVSVAEGTSEIAIGSDTGGSVRIPAALNGVVGFKPSARRIPLDGAFPLAPTLDSIGPLALSVADCIAADAIMAADAPVFLTPASLNGLRIGLVQGRLMEDMEPPVAHGFALSLKKLLVQGVGFDDVAIDDLLEQMDAATVIGSIAGIEASRIHRDWLGDRHAIVDFRVRSVLEKRALVSDSAYEQLIAQRNALVIAMDERLKNCDFVALVTTPITAQKISDVEHDQQTYNAAEELLLRNTQVANQFDLCSISLPMPISAGELPMGFMLFGRNGTDKALLRVALAIETAFQGK